MFKYQKCHSHKNVFSKLHALAALCALILLWQPAAVQASENNWRPVSAGWKISCGVDRGSIVRKSSTSYVFKNSSNKCVSRGTYNQRAELSGLYFSAQKSVSYQFAATVQMETATSEKFTIFQVHDGRGSCAPPLKIHWNPNNTLSFYSSYSLDKGAHDCVENAALVKQRYTGPRLRRDGTAYKLQVIMNFDGDGGFSADVYIDGKKSLSGNYTPPNDTRFFRSNRFYFKHGIYSKNQFPYQFISSDIATYRYVPKRMRSTTQSGTAGAGYSDR